MLVGDAAPWLDRFVSFDNRFLERIAVVWSSCLAVLPGQPEEDAITINSVHHLSKDSVVRGLCYWVEYHTSRSERPRTVPDKVKARSTLPCCSTGSATAILPTSASAST